MTILQSHIDKVTEMHEAYNRENSRDGVTEEHIRAEVYRDTGASILNGIVDCDNQKTNLGEALLHLFAMIDKEKSYAELGYSSLGDFVRAEYAMLPQVAYHYALRQLYAVEKLISPINNGFLPPIVSSDGEVLTGEDILNGAATSTITRIAQMPEFDAMTPEEKSGVISKIASGVSRDKIVETVRDAGDPFIIKGYVVEQPDGNLSVVFPSLDKRGMAYLQSSMSKRLNLILDGNEDVKNWVLSQNQSNM